jgi:hypothetical protein
VAANIVVDLSSQPVQSGAVPSPVVVPCHLGSNRITPFFPQLAHSFGGTKSAFETWYDPTLPSTETFRCWGNGDPITLVDEQGVNVEAHVGRWDAALYHGPLAASFTNYLALPFWKRYYPVLIAFNNLERQDREDYIKSAGTTGGENRCYTYPAFRHTLYHTDQALRQAGFDAMLSWNLSRIERRPYFHISKNANQGTPTVLIKPKVGSLGQINDSRGGGDPQVFDDLGNSRGWDSLRETSQQYQSWDKGHNNHQHAAFLAFAGHPLGAVNFWNIWRWYTPCFNPNHTQNNGYAFDQPRSAMWAVMMAVQAYLLGFEWADPDMIKFHVGGNANGDGTGQNGNAGWKPSEVLQTMAERLAGLQPNNSPPPGWFVDSSGCNDNTLTCVCDCAAAPPPGSGTSGCQKDGTGANTGNWIGPDGVNYGSQIRGLLVWQGMMCMFGSALLIAFHDYIVSIWPHRAPLTQSVYDALKQKLSDYTQQAIDRFFTSTWRGVFYAGVQATSYKSPEPAGYPETVAQAMLDDAVYCNPSRAAELRLKQVANRTDQWIVGDGPRGQPDEFYALTVAPMAMLLGPFHPMVETILAELLPPPGQESSPDYQYDDYSNAARYADIAYALRESGANIVVNAPVVAAGGFVDGQASHNVLIDAGAAPVKAGAKVEGNYGTQVLINLDNRPIKAGAKASASVGFTVVVDGATKVPKAGGEVLADYGDIPSVNVLATPVRCGGTVLGNWAPIAMQPIGVLPANAGAQVYAVVEINGNLFINADPVVAGAESLLQPTVLLDLGAFPATAGAFVSATSVVTHYGLVKNPIVSAGCSVPGSTPKHTYVNQYLSSGRAYVLEK